MSVVPSNVDIVRAHHAASARGDIAAMMARVSPQVRWTEMAGFPCAGEWVGPQAVIGNVFAVLGSEWHAFGRRLRTARISLETRKVLLGHKTGDITSHYSAPELAALIRAANAVLRRRS